MKVNILSSSNIWGTDSGRIKTDSLWLFSSWIVLIQSKTGEYFSILWIDFHESLGKWISHTFRLTVKTTSNNCEFKIILTCSFWKDQWLQSLNSVINVSKVVRDWFSINNDISCTMLNKNFRFSTFSLGMSVIFLSFIHFRFFYSFEQTRSFFKREIIEFSFRIDGHIFKIILKDHMFVFSEYMENLTFRMTIKIKWNSI